MKCCVNKRVSTHSLILYWLEPFRTLSHPFMEVEQVTASFAWKHQEIVSPWICTWYSCGGSWQCRTAHLHRSWAGSRTPGTKTNDRGEEKQLHEQWLTWQPSGRSKQSDLWEKNSCKEERRLLVLSLAVLPAATGKYDSGCKNKRNNLQHKLKLSAKIQQIFLLSTGWTCINCSGHKK